jgi:CheY-like chemotaxis protein
MEALGTLAGGIAHDFNNMLGIILGFADRAEKEPASQVEALASIRTASLRARDLVQQILAFGRRREHAMEPTDLKGLVVETMRLLRAAIPTSVVLDVVLPPHPVVVRADAAALQQVLVNLCTNAKHALRGTSGAKLTVSLDVSEGLARLRVADNGPGFSSAVADRLFEPFFTTKPLGEGTGMGLAVVHGIVASHGGDITASSTERGACFTVTLPLSADPMRSPRGSSVEIQRIAHVLVAEDEPLLARIVLRVLTEAGHAVTSCASAEDALAIVRDAPSTIDLVLTDLSMPGMRGDELARRLAELRPDLPCLVMSGHAETQIFDQAGAPRGFLQKPFVGQELLDAVEHLLARAARART